MWVWGDTIQPIDRLLLSSLLLYPPSPKRRGSLSSNYKDSHKHCTVGWIFLLWVSRRTPSPLQPVPHSLLKTLIKNRLESMSDCVKLFFCAKFCAMNWQPQNPSSTHVEHSACWLANSNFVLWFYTAVILHTLAKMVSSQKALLAIDICIDICIQPNILPTTG